MKNLAFVIIASFLLIGCVNGYKKYYKPVNVVPEEQKDLKQKPLLKAGSNFDNDFIEMVEDGYFVIGYSSFTGTADLASKSMLISHAKSIGAEVVIYYEEYLGSSTSAMPLTTPTTQVTTSNYTGSVGSTNYYGQGTHTTHGSRTTYIPITTVTNSYGAGFYRKSTNPIIFGSHVKDLSSEERTQLERNTGVKVFAVAKRSPAFMANIFRDDILLSFNGSDIVDASDYYSQIKDLAGKRVKISLIRNGKPLSLFVKLKQLPTEIRDPASK